MTVAGPSSSLPQSRTPGSSEYSEAGSDFEQDYSTEGESQSENDDGAYGAEDAQEGEQEQRERAANVQGDSKGKARATSFPSPRASEDQAHSTSGRSAPPEPSRSWSDLNVSIIIALISPIGHWLTGSDHVKHFCLLLLLVYYLHQLVEIPWNLYHKSRSYNHASKSHKTTKSDPNDAARRAAELALSELRSSELFYLFLSVVVPFLGAHLIHHIFAVMGVDTLSWFSTTLFVLATGVRPWSHLVKRLCQRMDDLHDAVEKPYNEDRHRIMDQKLASVVARVDSLEKMLQRLQSTPARFDSLQAVCDDLTEALGDVERAVRRHERKTELVRVSHNNRVAALETGMLRLEERNKHDLVTAVRAARPRYTHHTDLLHAVVDHYARLRDYVWRAFDKLLSSLPSYLVSSKRRSIPGLSSPSSSYSSPPMSPSALTGLSHPPSLTFNGTPLETIPEAADSDSDGTYVSDKDPSGALSPRTANAKAKLYRKRSRSRSQSDPRTRTNSSHSYSAKAIDIAAAVAAWPYRAAVTVLVLVVPELIQNLFA